LGIDKKMTLIAGSARNFDSIWMEGGKGNCFVLSEVCHLRDGTTVR